MLTLVELPPLLLCKGCDGLARFLLGNALYITHPKLAGNQHTSRITWKLTCIPNYMEINFPLSQVQLQETLMIHIGLISWHIQDKSL